MKRLPKHEETEAEQFRADLLNRMSQKYKIRDIVILIAVLLLFGAIVLWLKSSGVLFSIS